MSLVRQFVEINSSQGTSVSSTYGSFPLATLPGSTIAVFAYYSHSLQTASVCSDPVNGQYTLLNSVADTSAQGNTWLSSFAFSSASSLTPGTQVTLSLTAPDPYVGMIMYEIYDVSGISDHSALLQSAVTGANTLNSGSMAAPGNVLILATSYNTTCAGTSPYYPLSASGYILGGFWKEVAALSNNPVCTWEYETITNPGITTATFTSPSGASNDNFITAGIVFTIAPTAMIPVAWWA